MKDKPEHSQYGWRSVALVMMLVCASVLCTAYTLGSGDSGNSIPVVIESGSGVETASYIIYKDGDCNCLKNGSTGRILLRSDNMTTVLQSALDAVPDGGRIAITSGNYTLDYGVTGSAGAYLDCSDVILYIVNLNGTAIELGSNRSDEWMVTGINTGISGVTFIGDLSHDTTAIRINQINSGVVIDDVVTSRVTNGIHIYGACYSAAISDCKLWYGIGTAIHVESFTDGVTYAPNHLSIDHCLINGAAASPWNIGVDIIGSTSGDPADGVMITDCWFEQVNTAIYTDGDDTMISNNIIGGLLINIHCATNSTASMIDGNSITALSSDSVGIEIDGGSGTSVISDNWFNYLYGIGILGTGAYFTSTITGNRVTIGDASATFVMGCIRYSSIVGNSITSGSQQGVGLNLSSGSNNIVIGDNYLYSLDTGIYADGNQYYWTVDGNTFSGCKYGMNSTGLISSVVSDNNFIGSVIAATTGFSYSTTELSDNLGWLTENRGQATMISGETSTIVYHGLSVTPSSILCTGTAADVVGLWVSGINSTSFTINVASAVGANRVICWYAEV